MRVYEYKAIEWLVNSKGIPMAELVRGGEKGMPGLTHLGYGYEVKTLRGRTITFEKRQYESLRQNWLGEVLVFRENDLGSEPCMLIPFDKLPLDGGKCMGIKVHLVKSSSLYQCTIATSVDEKSELERIRGEIETKTLQQRDWADILLQAMYQVLLYQ